MITPAAAIEPSLSLHPSSVMAPLTQQMNHLSLGTTGTVRLSFYLVWSSPFLPLWALVWYFSYLSCSTFNIISQWRFFLEWIASQQKPQKKAQSVCFPSTNLRCAVILGPRRQTYIMKCEISGSVF